MIKYILISLLLVSCVPEKKEDDRKPSNTQNNDVSELVGTWQTQCQNSSSPDESYYLTFVFNPNGDSYFEENYFYGHDCSGASKDVFWKSYFTYSEGTDEIDFTRIKVEMTPQHADTVTSYNTTSWCQQTDWSINTLKNVTNLDCDLMPTDTSENISSTYTRTASDIEFFSYDYFAGVKFFKQ